MQYVEHNTTTDLLCQIKLVIWLHQRFCLQIIELLLKQIQCKIKRYDDNYK